MGMNYEAGIIDSTAKPLLKERFLIRDTPSPGECIIPDWSIQFDDNTRTIIDTKELTYRDHRISDEADPEDWLRLIRTPIGFLVDASHQRILFDEDHKIVFPIGRTARVDFSDYVPEEVDEPSRKCRRRYQFALDYISNGMQLEAARGMLRDQFGYVLRPSVLQIIADRLNEKKDGDSDVLD